MVVILKPKTSTEEINKNNWLLSITVKYLIGTELIF